MELETTTEAAPLVTRSAIRTFVGRLAATSGVRVTWPGAASMGGTKGDEAKLAKLYPAHVARALRQIGGASLRWETVEPPPGRDDVLRGWLSIPSIPAMLKHDFAYWDERRAETTFPADVRFTIVDAHDDRTMAWLVLADDGALTIRAAGRGDEKDSRFVASSLDEYLVRALEAGCLEHWQDPARDPGALHALRSLPLRTDATAEIAASDTIDEAQAKRWIKDAAAAQTEAAYAKDLKARAKALPPPQRGGMRLVRIRIEGSKPTFARNRAVAALVDAPGAERLVAACGLGDPRFDFNWGVPGLDAPMPESIIGVRHHGPPGATSLDVEILLAADLVPAGAVVGARYSTRCVTP